MADRRDVLALHIAHDPALALDLAIFSLARDHAGHFGYSDTGCTIRITDRNEPSGLTGIPAARGDRTRAAAPACPMTGRARRTVSPSSAFRSLDDGVKAGWLAYAAVRASRPALPAARTPRIFQSRLRRDRHRHGPALAAGAENSSTASRRRRSSASWAISEIALRYAAAKKTELATAAARRVGDTIIEPEIKAKRRRGAR
jgi:ParB family chromosome partitioning protein